MSRTCLDSIKIVKIWKNYQKCEKIEKKLPKTFTGQNPSWEDGVTQGALFLCPTMLQTNYTDHLLYKRGS